MRVRVSAPVTRIPHFGALITENQLLVGAGLVLIFTPGSGASYLVVCRNVSAGGQIIRVGSVPSFIAPVRGLALYPSTALPPGGGDSLTYDLFGGALYAIANGAGGLLDVSVWSS